MHQAPSWKSANLNSRDMIHTHLPLHQPLSKIYLRHSQSTHCLDLLCICRAHIVYMFLRWLRNTRRRTDTLFVQDNLYMQHRSFPDKTSMRLVLVIFH